MLLPVSLCCQVFADLAAAMLEAIEAGNVSKDLAVCSYGTTKVRCSCAGLAMAGVRLSARLCKAVR
jgi:hypothetical protein